MGILYLFTLGLLGFGWFIDLIIIIIKVFKNTNSRNLINPHKELAYIDSLSDGWQFENYTANLFKSLGYKNVKVTSGSGDFGIDVLAENNHIKYAIQCKLYSNPVGNKAVQEAYSGKAYYKSDKAVVITNSTFTKAAIELADSLDVILIDRTELLKLIKQLAYNPKKDKILRDIQNQLDTINVELDELAKGVDSVSEEIDLIEAEIIKEQNKEC